MGKAARDGAERALDRGAGGRIIEPAPLVTMRDARFIGYGRLVEACGQPGCPACRCVSRESRSYLEALLHEHVTDPDTRRAIRASWGFCNWHTWMQREIDHATFGSAIIYEDLVGQVLDEAARLTDAGGEGRSRGWLATLLGGRRRRRVERHRRRAVCPACRSAADAERRYLETLVACIDDGDLHAAYARSDGLCAPHLFAALKGNGDRPRARVLVEMTGARWRRLGQELGAFIAKHDYRNREPYTEAEAGACARALETLAGAPGVFGNDVHAPTAEGERRTPRRRG